MLYLLDANVLITANRDYYPIDQFPEYWEWLLHQAKAGVVKIPSENFDEIKDGPDEGTDALYAWIQVNEHRKALILDEEADADAVQHVVENGYANDLTDDEIEKVGCDPFLIAAARSKGADCCVVTLETSRPGAQRANRKIPDVCGGLGVKCCNTFEMNRALGFKTNWKGGG